MRKFQAVARTLAVSAVVALVAHTAQAAPMWAGKIEAEANSESLGSYAQWTDKVAVTVSYNQADNSIFDMDCAEVQFIARDGKPLEWGTAAIDDGVLALGYTPKMIRDGNVKRLGIKGKVTPAVVPICEGDHGGMQMSMFDGKIMPGMGGGPVFREADGKAVGIAAGVWKRGNGTAFLPYDVLLAAWNYGVQNGLIPKDLQGDAPVLAATK